MFAAVGARDDLHALGDLGDLILMPRHERQIQPRKVIGLTSQSPTAFVFFYFSTKGLRDDLMTETDAQNRTRDLDTAANEIF